MAASNPDAGLSLPVSVNELQRKLEEEVDRRRGQWEEEQGKSINEEEILTSGEQQKPTGESEGKVVCTYVCLIPLQPVTIFTSEITDHNGLLWT